MFVIQVHEATFPKFFSLPEGIPDARMFQHPIWSTWAEYHTHVNDSRVLEFARTVAEKGFNNSQVRVRVQTHMCAPKLHSIPLAVKGV